MLLKELRKKNNHTQIREDKSMSRIPNFTKKVIKKVLEDNEGFSKDTFYKGKNIKVTNHYEIKNGKMTRREYGKMSGGDGRFDDTRECDIDETRRVLNKFLYDLNLDGIMRDD